MSVVDRIHIFGASGSGVSTLGAALGERFGYIHLDVDEFFWAPSDPPFSTIREVDARRRLLTEALDAHRRWVLSGSLCGWGDIFIPRFQLAIFLYIPHDIRMVRILDRERQRFGADAIAPGGAMHQHHTAFIEWATAYDTADETMRSRRLHERWMSTLPRKCVRIEGPLSLADQIARLDGLIRDA
ncbi:MAG: hypothetical protein ACLQAT_01860 [Candidatus Binataceae bacterium]